MSSKPIYIVDSFTEEAFRGNPAGVYMPGDQKLEAQRMQQIAAELNLSETAFVSRSEERDAWNIRYFSPVMEIPLCGHATLAASKVLFDQNDFDTFEFKTHSGVVLPIKRIGNRVQMEFPAYSLQETVVPQAMKDALGVTKVHYAGYNKETNVLMLEMASVEELVGLTPDFEALVRSHDSIHGLSVTAVANDRFDFYSRFFWPWSGGKEDPVTGATHTFLTPYWASKLQKKKFKAFQASARTGQLDLELKENGKLLILGHAVMVLEGELKV